MVETTTQQSLSNETHPQEHATAYRGGKRGGKIIIIIMYIGVWCLTEQVIIF